jgi:hypothetical protein
MFTAVDNFFADVIRYGAVRAVKDHWRHGMVGKVLRAHWQYARYVLRHKYYVYRAGRKLGLGRWQLLVHDLSKFLPSEWFPYVYYFHLKPKPGTTNRFYRPGKDVEFDAAWLKHQHRNPHHWQYWLLTQDDDPFKIVPMPERFWREMIADWTGASMAQGYGSDVREWYGKHRDSIKLHRHTRKLVEHKIDYRHPTVIAVVVGTYEQYARFLERENLNPEDTVMLCHRGDVKMLMAMEVSTIVMTGTRSEFEQDKHCMTVLRSRVRGYYDKEPKDG